MPADPARIQKFSNDGIVISRVDAALKANFPAAEDRGSDEIEMFFRFQADAEAMVDERWNVLKQISRPHEGVEISTDLGLGVTIAVTPRVPKFTVIDAGRGLNAALNVRAFVQDGTTDRFSIELLG